MRRLYWFCSALTMAAKLQYIALALILGYNFVMIDLNPANQLFGVPLWMTTAPLFVGMIIIGRLLLPLMIAHPTRAQQFLHGFGLTTFGVWVFSHGQWWGGLAITYLSLMGSFWLEAACSFWFISEMGRMQEMMLAQMSGLVSSLSSSSHDEPDTNDDDLTEEPR